jgi:hypothetical protein
MKHRLSFVAAVALAAALSTIAICAVPAGAGTCATAQALRTGAGMPASASPTDAAGFAPTALAAPRLRHSGRAV